MSVFLGLDPGTVNFGYCIFDPTNKKIKFGMMNNPLGKGSGDVAGSLIDFVTEIYNIVERYKIKKMFAERYQIRGFRNPNIELVNLMLGTLVGVFGRDIGLVTASEWKRYFSSNVLSSDDLYNILRLKLKCSKIAFPNHCMDALLLALYSCGRKYKITREEKMLKFLNDILSLKTNIILPKHRRGKK